MSDYQVSPRGIGLDMTPGCYCCGGEDGLYSNVAFFVNSREDGEAIVKIFTQGARLDYRPTQPHWIQVKVGVCEKHKSNLEELFKLVIRTRGEDMSYTINEQIVKESKKIWFLYQ